MRFFLAVALGLLLACGNGSTSVPDAASAVDAAGPTDAWAPAVDADTPRDAYAALPDAGDGADRRTVSFGPDTIEPGGERTVCIVVDAGNDVPREVRALHTHLPQGSHHMIVYRTTDAVDLTPTPCFPFATAGEAVFIAESLDSDLVYPADAALAFEAHQHVRLEVHEIDFITTPIEVRASVTFDFYSLGDPPHMPVQFLFTGDMGISLPAHMTTENVSFQPVPAGARVFALTSHTHSLGIYAEIDRARGLTDFDTPPLHTSTNWADPPLDTFSPPLVFGSSEGLRLTCRWDNTTDSDVSFGLDFHDEMCFLWAYYY